MKPISQAWCCQIDVTNFCTMSCLYCSRYNRHLKKDQRSHMSVQAFEIALNSLEEWPGAIGIIGGEPLLHPQFDELCGIIRKHFPKEKMGLWTSGGKQYQEKLSVIRDTFGLTAYNEHNEEQVKACKHQPLTLSINEVVQDKDVREQLIDDCWVQRTWCPTINVYGAYFCEVAAAQDLLLNQGKNAWPVTADWWRRTPDQFQEQRQVLCGNCGMAIPIDREHIINTKEKFSPHLLTKFRSAGLKRVEDKDVTVFSSSLSREEVMENIPKWYPGNYRGDLVSDETCGEGRGFSGTLRTKT